VRRDLHVRPTGYKRFPRLEVPQELMEFGIQVSRWEVQSSLALGRAEPILIFVCEA